MQDGLDINEIANRLPHRYPFLMIDRVLHFEFGEDPEKYVGRKIVCRKNVTMNEPYFMGHFPENPVMPGVLQVETMAQAGAMACCTDPDKNLNVLIAKISEAKFRRPVIPGDILEVRAEILADKRSLLTVQCELLCDGDRVAEAKVMAKIIFEN